MTDQELGWLYTNKHRPVLVAQLEATGIQVIVEEADCGEGQADPNLRVSGKEIEYAGEKNIHRYIAEQQPLKTNN